MDTASTRKGRPRPSRRQSYEFDDDGFPIFPQSATESPDDGVQNGNVQDSTRNGSTPNGREHVDASSFPNDSILLSGGVEMPYRREYGSTSSAYGEPSANAAAGYRKGALFGVHTGQRNALEKGSKSVNMSGDRSGDNSTRAAIPGQKASAHGDRGKHKHNSFAEPATVIKDQALTAAPAEVDLSHPRSRQKRAIAQEEAGEEAREAEHLGQRAKKQKQGSTSCQRLDANQTGRDDLGDGDDTRGMSGKSASQYFAKLTDFLV